MAGGMKSGQHVKMTQHEKVRTQHGTEPALALCPQGVADRQHAISGKAELGLCSRTSMTRAWCVDCLRDFMVRTMAASML